MRGNMKILMVNKFLYPNGGSETYIFKLGEYLNTHGHEVQFFGMEHEGRIVGNRAESYTSDMDFHTGKLKKLLYPFKIIYSVEARKKIRKVLEDFKPDVVHLNNFNFQLTPSIIYEIRSFGKKYGKTPVILYTAHDYQWICPNHMMRIPSNGELCERCMSEGFSACSKHNCIHNSKVKSILGSVEAYFYRALKTYRYVDTIICPSRFLKEKLDKYDILKDKTVVLHNFIEKKEWMDTEKEDYVLYFGRYTKEKGVETLLQVCRELPEIPFVFAGGGDLEAQIAEVPNVKNLGFLQGNKLEETIRKARFSVFTSEWYENCPFSVMESQMYGTPIIAADIGGTPELVEAGKTGELYKSGEKNELKAVVEKLWHNQELCEEYRMNCKNIRFDTIEEYCDKLMKLYQKQN